MTRILGLNLTVTLPHPNGGTRSSKGRPRRSSGVSVDACFMLYGTPGKKGIDIFSRQSA
jgi:hypothetical protein